MRLARPSYSECAATRERISLELDDRLSELDRAYLRAHLGSCPTCRSYQKSVLAATRMLQTDDLEQPGFTIVLPKRRRIPIGALQATAGAAAIALVTTLAIGPGLARHGAAPLNNHSVQQRAFIVHGGKFVPAGKRAQRLTNTSIAL
jgi:hypothetical protein